MILTLVSMFCTLGQASAGDQDVAHAYGNKHVFQFIPSDSKAIRSFGCDEHGNEIKRSQNGAPGRREASTLVYFGGCTIFHSDSTGTSWVISYVPNPGTPARAVHIFKMKNSELILWAKFNPRDNTNVYASTGAQKFAGIKGSSNTDIAQSPDESGNNEVAQAPQPARENCADKNFFEKAACELKNAGIENAIGTINKTR